MDTAKLQKRQQVLINLITRVGGKNNIQKWIDELLKIDTELEREVKTMTYTYKGYYLIESGDEAGLYLNGTKLQTKFVSIYSIDGFVEWLDEDGLNWCDRLRAEGKDPVKPSCSATTEQLELYTAKKAYQQSLEDSFANGEWKLVWREQSVAQTGIATEQIPVWKHTGGKFPERYNTRKLQIQSEEDADKWLKEAIKMNEIEALNNARFSLFIDHHFFGGIFSNKKEEYSYQKWCEMEEIVNENDYYSTSPEVSKAKAYLRKFKKQGEADSRAEFEKQWAERQIRVELKLEKILNELEKAGIKREYCEKKSSRESILIVGGIKKVVCQNDHYEDLEICSIEQINSITADTVQNAAKYYREHQAKKDYLAYKSAQGNKPCKSFEKWLATI